MAKDFDCQIRKRKQLHLVAQAVNSDQMCCVNLNVVCFIMLGNSWNALAMKPVHDSRKCDLVELWEVTASSAFFGIILEHSDEEWGFHEDCFVDKDAVVIFADSEFNRFTKHKVRSSVDDISKCSKQCRNSTHFFGFPHGESDAMTLGASDVASGSLR